MSIYSQLTQTRVNAGRRPPRNSETKSLVSETDFTGHLLRGNVSPYSCGPTQSLSDRLVIQFKLNANRFSKSAGIRLPLSTTRLDLSLRDRDSAQLVVLWFSSYIKASLLSAYVNLHPCRNSDTVSGGISVSDLRL